MPNTFHDITFRWDAVRVPHLTAMLPGVNYYASTTQIGHLEQLEARLGMRLFDDHGERSPGGWNGEDLNGRRAAYYHDGQLGDELIHSAFYRQIRLQYPAARLHAVVKYRGQIVLAGNRYAGDYPLPWGPFIPVAAAAGFDHWIIPSSVGYHTRGSTENIYHQLEAEIGIKLDERRPYINIPSDMRRQVRERLVLGCYNAVHLPEDFWNRMILVQLNASEPERTPANWYERLFAVLSIAYPDYLVAVIGDVSAAHELVEEGGIFGNCKLPVHLFLRGGDFSLAIESILVMTEAAHVVICPDSFVAHAAAAFDVPTVALWQLDPAVRTAEGLRLPPPSARVGTYGNVRVAGMLESPDVVAGHVARILGRTSITPISPIAEGSRRSSNILTLATP